MYLVVVLHRRQVLDRHWINRVGEGEVEDLRVEEQLGFEGAPGGLGFAEAMLFTFEGQIREGQTLGAECLDHDLSLGWWNHLVVEALEQDDRAGQAVGEVNWRALVVDVLGRGP